MNFARNLEPGNAISSIPPSPRYSLHPDHWGVYYDCPTPPLGYHSQPSPYSFTPVYSQNNSNFPTPSQGHPSPYSFAPIYPQTPYALPQGYPTQPGPNLFTPDHPQTPHLSQYQYPPTFDSTDALGQLPPVFDHHPQAPGWSNTVTPLSLVPHPPVSWNAEAQQPPDIPDIQLHHELCWNNYWTEFSRGIIWDVTLPPLAARLSAPRLFYPHSPQSTIVEPSSEASAITTQSRFDRIELLTDHPYLAYYMGIWGPIFVSETNPTVFQLLEAIYEYLNTPLTEEDYQCASLDPQNVPRLSVSRESRIRDGFDAVYTAAIQGPFRRSDILGGHRRFLGIRVVKLQDETLTLHFNLGPGPVSSFY